MKTRSLGIAFAALLAFAPVRGSAEDAASPAGAPRAKTHLRRHAGWEPFPLYKPHLHRHHISWRRLAWFNWL